MADRATAQVMENGPMRAVHIASFDGQAGLRAVEMTRPAPKADEVLVRVRHCGVNPVDRSQSTGRWTWLALPHVPGSEISGVVEEAGALVSHVQPGTPAAVACHVFCGRCHYCLRGREEACNADPRSANAPMVVGLPSEGGDVEYVIAPGLEQAADAMRALEDPQRFGKIVLDVG